MASEPASSAPEAHPWRALHPASLAVNLLPQAWRLLKAFWPLLLVTALSRPKTGGGLGDYALFLIFVGMSVANTVVHFLTLRYRVVDGRLQIRHGLLNRLARSVDASRVQNVILAQNLFHRAVGLVEVRVETAGDQGVEGLLSALSVEEARRLRTELEAARGQAAPAEDGVERGPPPALLTNGVLESLAYGFTQRWNGLLAVILLAAMDLPSMVDPELTADVAQRLGARGTAAVFLLALALSWAVTGGASVLRHWAFRAWREGDLLLTEEGLTTRNRVQIPVGRLQLVSAVEPLVRRWMGFGTLTLETAAVTFDEQQVRQAEAILPMVPSDRLGELCFALAPGLDVDPWRTKLHPAHPIALVGALAWGAMRGIGWAGLAALLTTGIFGAWSLLALLLAPLGLPMAALDWQRQGWVLSPAAVVVRRGFMTQRTELVLRARIQSVLVLQGPLLRWVGLARLVVNAAGSAVVLPLMTEERALTVLEELRPRSAPQERLDREHAEDDAGHVGGEPGGDRAPGAGDAD